MRIAIPSDDRSTITPHFGRADGFLIYTVDGAAGQLEGYRPLHAPPQHVCACETDERPSRHQRVLDVLDGCDTVIARGMGAHLYDDLLSCGIDVALTDIEDARAAVDLFLARSLPERPGLGCDAVH